ncbi:MAG TPA: hypothetical protein VK689_04495, partial [Armatimonadota bacterium]|nr:hypothetical protein [Armatimonadota bacterium]
MMTSRLLPLSSALLAGLVAVAILAASPVAAAVISDDFNDNRRNDALWIPTGDGVGPRLSERQGRLEVAFPSNSAGGIFLGGYFTRLQFRSDLDVQVDYELPEWPQANGVRVGLTLIRVGGGAVASAERMSVGTREEDISPSDFYLVDLGIPEGHQPT